MKGIEGTGHHFLCPGTGNDIAVENQHHIVRIVIAGIVDAVPEIRLGVRSVNVDGLLGAGDDDGLPGILYHIAEGRRGISHGIRTVGDDKAVIAVVILLDGRYDQAPDLRTHIGGIQIADLLHVNGAVLLHIRHKLQNLRRRQGWLQAVPGLL